MKMSRRYIQGMGASKSWGGFFVNLTFSTQLQCSPIRRNEFRGNITFYSLTFSKTRQWFFIHFICRVETYFIYEVFPPAFRKIKLTIN